MNHNHIGLTGIIPFTYFGAKVAGSTLLRAEGLAANADDFEIWKHGKKYDNLIFQKAYWKEMMLYFNGPRILDLCDADWLSGDVDIMDIGNYCDAITCSSENLTKLLKKYFPKKPVQHVPDRLNFKIFPSKKGLHQGRARNLVWFGFIHNAHETLDIFSDIIQKYELNLTIISDEAYSKEDAINQLNPRFIKYDPATVYSVIQQNDIVLNPKSNRVPYKYKSNNKTVIGWKLGMPVAATVSDLERLMDPGERNKEVKEVSSMVEKEYNIIKSAEQYRSIIGHVRNSKFVYAQ